MPIGEDYLVDLDAYCINAYYPSMETNFYHPDTRIYYYVVEFDPGSRSGEGQVEVDHHARRLGDSAQSGAAYRCRPP